MYLLYVLICGGGFYFFQIFLLSLYAFPPVGALGYEADAAVVFFFFFFFFF